MYPDNPDASSAPNLDWNLRTASSSTIFGYQYARKSTDEVSKVDSTGLFNFLFKYGQTSTGTFPGA